MSTQTHTEKKKKPDTVLSWKGCLTLFGPERFVVKIQFKKKKKIKWTVADQRRSKIL